MLAGVCVVDQRVLCVLSKWRLSASVLAGVCVMDQ